MRIRKKFPLCHLFLLSFNPIIVIVDIGYVHLKIVGKKEKVIEYFFPFLSGFEYKCEYFESRLSKKNFIPLSDDDIQG